MAAAMGSANLYKVLSLESERASPQEIKKAYRSLARRLHPDVCPPERREQSSRAMVAVNRAYETLSDPALRRSHDAELSARRSGAAAAADARRWAPRGTWEAQLSELERRSALRMRRRDGSAACGPS